MCWPQHPTCQHPTCWDQNTSRIQMLRHFDFIQWVVDWPEAPPQSMRRLWHVMYNGYIMGGGHGAAHSFIRSTRPFYIHATRSLLLKRQGIAGHRYGMVSGGQPRRLAGSGNTVLSVLSDHGNRPAYTLHGGDYSKDRGRPASRVKFTVPGGELLRAAVGAPLFVVHGCFDAP